MRSESGNGSGFSRTAFTTLKIAVFAPIPSVSTASAEIVKPGFLRSTRIAWVSDWRKSRISERGALRPPFRKLFQHKHLYSCRGAICVRVWHACVRRWNCGPARFQRGPGLGGLERRPAFTIYRVNFRVFFKYSRLIAALSLGGRHGDVSNSTVSQPSHPILSR